ALAAGVQLRLRSYLLRRHLALESGLIGVELRLNLSLRRGEARLGLRLLHVELRLRSFLRGIRDYDQGQWRTCGRCRWQNGRDCCRAERQEGKTSFDDTVIGQASRG